jgi:hypothetical protein
MASFKRLTLDQLPDTKVDVNMDMVHYVEPFEGYSRLYFEGRYVDVKETPEQIKNTSKLPKT